MLFRSFMDKTLENQDKSKESKGNVKKSKIIKKIKTKPVIETEESEGLKENMEDSKTEQE